MAQVLTQAPESPEQQGPNAIAKEKLAREKKQREDDKKADKAIDMQAVAEKKAIDAKVAQHKSDVADVERDEVSPVPNASDATEAAQLDPALPAEVPQEAAVDPALPAEVPQEIQEDPQADFRNMLAESMKPDPRQIELEQKLAEAFETRMGQSQAEIDNLKTLRDDLAKPSTATDYSSLIKSLDAFSGENNFQFYTPPTNPKEEIMQQAGMQEKIAKLQGAMTDDQLNFLKTQLQKKTQTRQAQMLFKLEMEKARQGRFDTRLLHKESVMLQKDFTGMADEATGKAEIFDNLSGLLMADADGNVDFQSIQIALGNFARVVGGEKGVLTDRDVLRVVPRNIRGDAAKVAAYFSQTDPSTYISEEFVKNLRAAITRARAFAVKKYKTQVDGMRDRGNASRFSRELWKYGSDADRMATKFMDKITTSYMSSTPPASLTAQTQTAAPQQGEPVGAEPDLGIDKFFEQKGKR